VNHLDHIPPIMPEATVRIPRWVHGAAYPYRTSTRPKSWSYFTSKWHPMISDSFATNYANHAMDGIYYNGGSWMRIEICGYVAGKLHGWNGARKAIANRLWAEINISPDFPTSQEYLATDPAHPFFWLPSGFRLEFIHPSGTGASGPSFPGNGPGLPSRPQAYLIFHRDFFCATRTYLFS